MALARYRFSAAVAPEPTPTKVTRTSPRAVPLRLNRNLGNFPLARSARTRSSWKRGKRTRRWQADLPGENRIQIWFPAKAAKAALRVPTGFDMGVLFRLLAEVQREPKHAVMAFSTASVILRHLGLYPNCKARKRLFAALDLWSAISVRYLEWYEPPNNLVRKVLPPPIKTWEQRGYALVIEMHPEWIKLALDKKFYERIALPLPLDASEQNMALQALVFGEYQERGRTSFARKIGLSRWHRRQRLLATLERVSRRFEAHAGALDLLKLQGRKIGLFVKKPSVPRWRKTAEPPAPQVETYTSEPLYQDYDDYQPMPRREELAIDDPFADR